MKSCNVCTSLFRFDIELTISIGFNNQPKNNKTYHYPKEDEQS